MISTTSAPVVAVIESSNSTAVDGEDDDGPMSSGRSLENGTDRDQSRTESSSSAPFLPTAIPKTNNDDVVGVSVAADEEKTTHESGPESSVKGKNRSLDNDLPTGQQQGRAFTNFVTAAPATGKSFDLSDVSLDEDTKGTTESDSEAGVRMEATCSHDGKTFKVSQEDELRDGN